MKYACLVDTRDGDVWKVPFTRVKWTTKQNGEAGRLEFSFLRDKEMVVEPGNVVRFDMDDTSVFYGYVFDIRASDKDEIEVTAYDQLLYLRYKDTYKFREQSASDILRAICADTGLAVGTIEETGYKMNLCARTGSLIRW